MIKKYDNENSNKFERNLSLQSDERKNNVAIKENDMNRAVLNVGGIRHECLWKTLERLPNTRLGKLRAAKTDDDILQLCDDYNRNEYFFDRHPRSFAAILNFYRTGRLHLIEDVCVLSFQDDLKYWGIEEFCLHVCCFNKYQQKKDNLTEEMRQEEVMKVKHVEEFIGCCPKIRKKVWDLMENPQTSKCAQVS